MKNVNVDCSQIKIRQQIFNLKTIISNSTQEYSNLKSNINEFQNIFKSTKKIIKEKINLIEKSKTERNKSYINDIKKQICFDLKEIIKKYQYTNHITKKIQKYRKEIKEKNNKLKILLNQLKYNELKNEKDLLIQTIKEKNNILEFFKSFAKYEKDFLNFIVRKNINYLDNIYNIKIDSIQKDKNYKKIINQKDIKKQKLVKTSEKKINDLKIHLKNNEKKFNDYIYKNGFKYEFQNIKCKEKYNFEISLIEKYNDSSESDSNIDSNDEHNVDVNNSLYKNEIFNIKNINKNIFKSQKNSEKSTKYQINSITLSNKETNDQERSLSSNSNNLYLINKLVKLKEKYNKLINEKFEIENEIILKKKDIKDAKTIFNNKLKNNSTTSNDSKKYNDENIIIKY